MVKWVKSLFFDNLLRVPPAFHYKKPDTGMAAGIGGEKFWAISV